MNIKYQVILHEERHRTGKKKIQNLINPYKILMLLFKRIHTFDTF